MASKHKQQTEAGSTRTAWPLHAWGHEQHPARWLAVGVPGGIPGVLDVRNLFAPASPLGLVMLGMTQGNKIWFSLEEENK